MTRALRRPFRVGGNTVYTLPAALGGVQWAIANSDFRAKLELRASVRHAPRGHEQGRGADAVPAPRPEPELLRGDRRHGTILDTAIPGYKPEWRVSFTGRYFRKLVAQRVTGVETATTSVTELTTAPALAGTDPARPPAAHARAPTAPMAH